MGYVRVRADDEACYAIQLTKRAEAIAAGGGCVCVMRGGSYMTMVLRTEEKAIITRSIQHCCRRDQESGGPEVDVLSMAIREDCKVLRR